MTGGSRDTLVLALTPGAKAPALPWLAHFWLRAHAPKEAHSLAPTRPAAAALDVPAAAEAQKRHRRSVSRSFSPSATGSASAIVQECLERLLLRRYSARSRRAHRKHSTIRGENLSDSACGGLRPE